MTNLNLARVLFNFVQFVWLKDKRKDYSSFWSPQFSTDVFTHDFTQAQDLQQ